MQNKDGIKISSFPEDNERYIVTNFGLIRKNPSPGSSPYLVELMMQNINSSKRIVREVLLTHLFTARIGSVWQNQRKVESYSVQTSQKYQSKSIRLKLGNTTPPKTMLLVRNRKSGAKKLRPPKNVVKNTEEILSIFTAFATESKMRVYIPAMEILTSSYVPQTHEILHDLSIHSIDDVLSEHISDFEITADDNNCIYNIRDNKSHVVSTLFFLSYLACNDTTRKNVSKIRSSLMSNCIIKGNRTYSWMEVFPYHPTKYEITATGLFNEEKNMFWVHRIEKYAMPTDCNIILYKKDGKDEEGEHREDTVKKLANTDRIEKELDLVSSTDAGRTAGVKYIKSEVETEIPWENILVKQKRKRKAVSVVGETERTEAEAAAATPQSGSEASKPIAGIGIEAEEKEKNENYLSMLIEAINKLENKIRFFGNNGKSSPSLQFCTLEVTKAFDGTKSRWALIKKDRPRKLLVCEVSLAKGFMYILDIERKNSESYLCIAFKLESRLEFEMLEKIRKAVSFNKGVFRGENKHRKKFPVLPYTSFRHRKTVESMKKKIEELADEGKQ